MTDKPPNPGTKEALKLGCECPVLDNARGKGYTGIGGGPGIFIYTVGCPVHPLDDFDYSENQEEGE